ncbi:MAG: hypothetical protein ACRDCX_09805, partial [Aeromonas sp.]
DSGFNPYWVWLRLVNLLVSNPPMVNDFTPHSQVTDPESRRNAIELPMVNDFTPYYLLPIHESRTPKTLRQLTN